MAVSNTKKVLARAYEDYGKFLEPFAILLSLVIIALPVITVINLSVQAPNTPVISDNKQTQVNSPEEDVLGAQDQSSNFTVELVSGNHSIIKDENLLLVSPDRYLYKSELYSHEAGTYSKPIVEITNDNDMAITVNVLVAEFNGDSYLSAILLNQKDFISTPKDGFEMVEFQIAANSTEQLYLSLFDREDVNFKSIVELIITAK